MDQLTKKEWVILQQALVDYQHSGFTWNDEADGPDPTVEEIDALAEKVGNMDHGD